VATPFRDRRYCIEKYDVSDALGEEGRWETVAVVTWTRDCVAWVRSLFALGYSEVSVSVGRLDEDPEEENAEIPAAHIATAPAGG
jgi:hypothetical protein